MSHKKKISFFLVLSLILSLLPYALAEEQSSYATRSEAAALIQQTAGAYNPLSADSNLLRGYEDGSILEDRVITRIEALTLLSRAFGTLDAPNKHYARLAQTDISFGDVPLWAESEVANLVAGGVLTESDGMLLPNEPVSLEEVDLLLRRIWALKGENLKDDFYAAINKDALATAEIRPGDPSSGTIVALSNLNDDRIAEIIAEIVAGEHEAGSREAKIATLYQNVMDYEARNQAGITPILPYLEAVDAAENLDDLLAVRGKLLEDTGVTLLLGFAPQIDLKDSNRYMLSFSGASVSLPKDYYAMEYGPVQQIYVNYLAKLYQLSGMETEAAEEAALQVYQLEQALAAEMLDVQDYGNVDKIYNLYTMDQLQALFPKINLSEMLLADGYLAADTFVISDPGILKAYSAYFEDEQLPVLKATMKLSIISGFSGTLNEDFEKAGDEFQQMFIGVQGEKSKEERASLIVQNVLSDYLEEIYIEEYFSEEAKADVERMIREFIAIYKERLMQLDWMSETTKEMAMRKLDTMKLKIGYPDERDEFMDDVEFIGVADGGSFYDNVCAIARKRNTENLKKQNEPVDKSEWFISAYTVNAFYNVTANEIVFPAGILQAPFYDINASVEENLGGIGFVIAHEITHSFDNNGAKFDENGNAANWWTEEDYATFNELCEAAVAFYDGQEVAPGIRTNGRLTLSENIADLGALSCIVEALGRMVDEPDYQGLFINMARCWLDTTGRDYANLLAQLDVHSAQKVRTNRTIQSSDEFYNAFDIQPGDGMYLAPEQRVKIW